MKNRIKAAINCLRGNPTAYRITLRNGSIFAKTGDNALITECLIEADPEQGKVGVVYG